MTRLLVCVFALIYSIIYTIKPVYFLNRANKRHPMLDEDGSGVKKTAIEITPETIRRARKYGYIIIAITTFCTLYCAYQIFLA